MKKVSIFATALALSILFLASFAYAAPSKTIPIQGKLTNPTGVPYNGQYSMTFKIFDVATSGTLLYTETLSNIPVSTGLFSVVLGESTPLALSFDKDYYIEVTVGSETLSPRQRLLSAPYAIYSQNSSYSTNAGSAVNTQNAVTAQSATTAQTANTALTATNLQGGSVNATSVNSTGNIKADGVVFINGGGIYSSSPSLGFLTSGGSALPVKTGSLTISDAYVGNDAPFRGLYVQGNIGIGTTTPQAKLDVNGNIFIRNNSKYLYLFANEEQNGAGIVTNAVLQIGSMTQNNIIVDTNGNVGIGGNMPTEKLDVIGNVKASGLCLGSDCKTSWPSSFSLPQDVQFNSVNITTNLKVSGSINIASDLIIGLIPPTLNTPISYASASGTLSNIGATYCYKITAYNGAGESKTSVEKCIAPGAGHNTINLSWTPVEFATGYKVYGRTSTTYGLIGTVTDTKLTDLGTIAPGAQPSSSATVGNIKATGGATFDGNVGIGTANPSERLSVNGSITIAQDSFSNGLVIFATNPTQNPLTISKQSGSSTGPVSKLYEVKNNGDVYMSGSVGIGTNNPKATLDVNGNLAHYSATDLKLARFEYGDQSNIWIKRYYMNKAGQPAMAFEILGKTYEKSDSDVILNLTNPNNWDITSSCCPACAATFTCPARGAPSPINTIVYIYAMPSENSLDFKLSRTAPNQYNYNPNNATMKAIAGFALQRENFVYFSYDPVSHYVSFDGSWNILNGGYAGSWTAVDYSDKIPKYVATKVTISTYSYTGTDGGLTQPLVRPKGSVGSGSYVGYAYDFPSAYAATYELGNRADLNIINGQNAFEYYLIGAGTYTIGPVYFYLEGYYMR